VFPEARLRLLGYGHEPGGLAQAWALARNLGDGVEFIGEVPQSDVPRHFSEAHLMVHPSQEEAFGHVLIEAMGMGTPVIAAAEAQAPTWILGQGRNGVVVPCHSPGPWEAVGLAGWTAARREFTVARMTEAYLALYRQILGA
jgi:glycosyltransferase involved in cell wall biosynthesis